MRAYLRLASHPNHHPITKITTRTRAHQVRKHRTALHHLADITGINPSRLEKIGTQRYRPGDKTPIIVKIAGTKELSIAWDNEHCNRGVVIYTDRSGLQGTIGTAAILFINGIRTDELRYQLSSDKQHTVFEGELVAILLGLHLARRHIETHPSFSISVDNQAAIKSISNNQAQPAQYIIDKVKLAIRELIVTGQEGNRNNRFINTAISVMLTWVAGHMGSKGNEAADELARAATEFSSSNNSLLPDLLKNDLPGSISATKQYTKLNTKRDTIKWWKCSECYKKIKAIDPSLPSKTYLENTGDLSHSQTSLLTQLRTGHVPLNQHLHCIGRSNTPHCQHCPGTVKNVTHLLLFCRRHAHHHHRIAVALKRKAHDISHLLANTKAIRYTLNFLHSTRRFEHTHSDISMSLVD